MSSTTCECPKGCTAPKYENFNFCSKKCGSQTCVHPSVTLAPVAQLQSLSLNSSAKCSCAGCTQPAFPPHTFCSKKCGYKTCGHNPQSTPSSPAPLQSSGPSSPSPAPHQPPSSSSASSAAICACVGCSFPVYPNYTFCSKKCGLGVCGHSSQATSSSSPAAKCACAGCTLAPNPPHLFCSQPCGVGTCGHPGAVPGGCAATPAPAKCACTGCTAPSNPPHQFCSQLCGVGSCGHNTSTSSSSSGPKCACPACPTSARPSFEYCSKKCGTRTCGHAQPGPACRCKGCKKKVSEKPKSPGRYLDFCDKNCETKRCGHTHKPGLINKLSVSDPAKYNEIKQQFMSKWLHSYTPPTKIEIYTVDVSIRKAAFEAYRQSIIAKRPHLAKGTPGKSGPGNSRRRFHGTNLNCNLGKSSMDPCSKSDCRVCQILKSGGLMTSKFGAQTGWGRFGNGIYLTSTSSKANDYSRGATKAIFMLEVIVGETVKLTADDQSLTSAPGGKDSVVGEAGATSVLNYDELVVYNDDACILKYLFVYS